MPFPRPSISKLRQLASRKLGGSSLKAHAPSPNPPVTHFLQQGHTYSNKATPPNSVTPWAKGIQTATVSSLLLFKLSQSPFLVKYFIVSPKANAIKVIALILYFPCVWTSLEPFWKFPLVDLLMLPLPGPWMIPQMQSETIQHWLTAA